MAGSRVYEVAKILNITSKRLIEKLKELSIEVKNHMSLLTDEEIGKLYKYVGFVQKKDKEKKSDNLSVTEKNREKKRGPFIIRKSQVYLDSNGNVKESAIGVNNNNNNNNNGKQKEKKKNSENTGLRQGFVYEDNSYDKLLEEMKAKKLMKQQEEKKKELENRVQKQDNIKENNKKNEKFTPKVNGASEQKSKESSKVNRVSEQKSKEHSKVNRASEQKSKESSNVNGASEQKSKESSRGRNASGQKDKVFSKRHNANQSTNNSKHSENVKQSEVSNNKESRANTHSQKNSEKLRKNNKSGVDNAMRSSGANKKMRDQADNSNRRQNTNRNNAVRSGDGDANRNTGVKYQLTTRDTKTKELNEKQAESLSKQERREFSIKTVEKEKKREQKKENLGNRISGNKEHKYDNTRKYMKTGKGGVAETILDEFYNEPDKFVRRGKIKQKPKEVPEKKEMPKAQVKNITVGDVVTVKEIAEVMKKTAAEVIKKLMFMGMMVTVNSELDFDTAVLVGDEFGIKVDKQVEVNEEEILFKDDEVVDETKLKSRPPVVVVMGHVDHGKTSLLDAIRKTNVIIDEAGGITQHIGAHTVKINNKSITFLDTPGHEAFTAMRARGAEVTDVVVLVVAADDGVMPQTIEAIDHAKAAKVSIIVAVNKIDKEGANPDKVKQELSEYGLIPEEWGGDTIFVQVSAKKRQGIEDLLEMITLVSEMLELKANPDRQARGTIIEAKLDKDRGPIATLLVQEGTLNVGDSIIAGVTFGRIRAMVDDKGKRIKKAGPSTPVEILGLHEVPEAGEVFHSITDEKLAKSLIEKRKLKYRQKHLKSTAKISLDDLYNQIQSGNIKDLNLVVKADVQGSVEAVKQSLQKLTNEEVRINIVHGGVGAITEQDIILAQVSNAIVIGFNVRPALNVAEIAKDAGVDLRLYRVIYNAIEDIQAAMKGMLDPTYKEVVLGHVEIRQIFKVSGIGTIGGAYVLDGKITRHSNVRVVRDGIVVNEGKLASLKRFKDDVKEVAQGFECGLSIESFNDIKEGDVVEAFEMQEVERE